MTHNLNDDAALAAGALNAGAPWVGLLGPRRRAARVIQQMKDANILPPLDVLGRLETPVGLDLGADDPGEVAMSIIAAIVAARNGRPGGGIQKTGARIHDEHQRIIVGGEQ
jgi:xanthine/CO dehydrogenase XdhC/CoxF family maturation factor